ncbi:MAG: GAF domain-containing protein [Flavobacteriaceae bacterium]|nr:GAF domain-containing protein [Flavobacteriaceae bacterium]
METIKQGIDHILSLKGSKEELLQRICDFLQQEVEYYDWVGFYFRNGNKEELKLAQFAGKPTEHTLIPFGKGICGQVAVSNENFVVQDVSEQNNYISCGIEVQSEIVVPIFVNGQNIGQIDIDSHSKKPFTAKDEELLEYICGKVAGIL